MRDIEYKVKIFGDFFLSGFERHYLVYLTKGGSIFGLRKVYANYLKDVTNISYEKAIKIINDAWKDKYMVVVDNDTQPKIFILDKGIYEKRKAQNKDIVLVVCSINRRLIDYLNRNSYEVKMGDAFRNSIIGYYQGLIEDIETHQEGVIIS